MSSTATATVILSLALLLANPCQVESNAFRGAAPSTGDVTMRAEDVRAAMLQELLSALGHSNRVTELRLVGIESALRSTFLAMPKNEQGNLDHNAVRYVLHRFFVQRHGIFMKGLEPWGESWNSSAATEILEDRVPSFVQNLFEERLFGRGLGLHELAILAATLEHLIHDEAMGRLKSSFQVHGLSLDQRLPEEQLTDVIDTYMILFLRGATKIQTAMDVHSYKASIASEYPGWTESQKFTRNIQNEIVNSRSKADPDFDNGVLTFNATVQVVEEIGDRYGPWQDFECRDMKATLLKIERAGTGRVPLTAFYGHALSGAWQFTESVPYLRDLGALDEVSDPAAPSVIVPNYVNSHSNCLGASSMYSICCLNECEPLIGHLEHEISEPDAFPERVIELVSNLPSSTVAAPRVLPEALKARLRDVANHHGGRVPLHGRLFMQWMHHAYPRECPYPHLSGTTSPMTPAQKQMEGKHDMLITPEDLVKHTNPASSVSANTSAEADSFDLHWNAEEELVAPAAAQRARGQGEGIKVIIWALLLLCAAASLRQPLVALVVAAKGLVGKADKESLPLVSLSHGNGKAHFC